MTVTIGKNDGKILATPSGRLSPAVFRAFRGAGWLWSGRFGAFVFNDNDGGALRVSRLVSGQLVKAYEMQNASDSEKEEAAGLVFEYEDEKTAKSEVFYGI